MLMRTKTITDCENEEFARFDVGHVFTVGERVVCDFRATSEEWSGEIPERLQGKPGTILEISRTNALGNRERPFLVDTGLPNGCWWLSKREIRQA